MLVSEETKFLYFVNKFLISQKPTFPTYFYSISTEFYRFSIEIT